MRVILFIWLACLCLMVGLSLIPHLVKTPNDSDKMLHVVAYCILMIGPVMAGKSLRFELAVAALLFAIGAGIEFFQHIMGGRLSSIEDALANGAGIFCGLVIGYLIRSGLRAAPPETGRRDIAKL